MHENYESPTLTTVGSVRGLTQGKGILGHDDSFVFHIGGIVIDIPYGQGS